MADKISTSQRALPEVMSHRYLKSAIYPSQCNVEKTTEMDCILWPVPAFGWAPVKSFLGRPLCLLCLAAAQKIVHAVHSLSRLGEVHVKAGYVSSLLPVPG